MFYNVSNRIDRALFNLQCRRVFDTPAATLNRDSELAVLTQLQHKDVLMAALAFKSFARHVPVGAFYVVNDGSLTANDQAMLKAHLPGVTFFTLAEFASPKCPRGGTWERLLAIAELSRDHYVIQLDSDTLTLDAMPEVCAAVNENRSFAIGTWDNQDIETMQWRQSRATRITSNTPPGDLHIQVLSEANFDKLHNFNQLRYVRGCSGFSGFARRSCDRQFVESLSSEMFAILGKRWTEWGSEQVMSNIVIANTTGACVLPHPKYCDCTQIMDGETVFVHFIGTCRFAGRKYARLATHFVQQEISTDHRALP